MPYRYRDDIAIADAAFEAWGATAGEMFKAAADATLGVMVEEIEEVHGGGEFAIWLDDDNIEMLLFSLLGEIIYYKDAEELLVRIIHANIKDTGTGVHLDAVAQAVPIDRTSHRLTADVKAVTLHRFKVGKTAGNWRATVVLDI